MTHLEAVKAKHDAAAVAHKLINPDCSCPLCYRFPKLNLMIADSTASGVPMKDLAAAKKAAQRQSGAKRKARK